MNKQLHFLLVMLFAATLCSTAMAQSVTGKENLRKQLWSFADYDMNNPRTDMDEFLRKTDVIDNTSEVGYIEDVANGYLYIRDGGPPCGCYYDKIVGVFKTADGYTLLRNSYDYCPQSYSCVPSRSWDRILPDGFDLEYFYKKGEEINSIYTMFYIEVGIPRYGRETTFTTKIVPFGINGTQSSGIDYTGRIAFTNTLAPYSGWDFSYLKETDLAGLNKRETYSQESLEELVLQIYSRATKTYSWLGLGEVGDAVKLVYQVYEEYKKIDFQTVTMEWDSAKGRFVVKSVVKHQKINNFLDFLLSDNYWMAAC